MTLPLDRLRTALADRFQVEGELGRGGMATVYRARDLKHDRAVALKVLHPELASAIRAERFFREIRIAAQLTHPNILPLLDSGEADGFFYYVMPLLTGDTLRTRLKQQRQLAIPEALRIAGQVAAALGHAHRHGVIHRDIKPENILLQDGEALVADFGIAFALTGAGERLTETGLSIGTPEYMSPEQATGERMLDARSDVYALACVLYEMLAGEPPLTGPSTQAIVAKLMTERPVRLRIVRDTVPVAVDDAVAKGLAKVPADRFESAEDFSRALAAPADAGGAPTATRVLRTPRGSRRLLYAVAALVLSASVIAVAWTFQRTSTAAGAEKLVAVLPFENEGAAEDEYFADGLSDDLRGKLTQIPGVEVVARGSSTQYRHTAKPLRVIAKELGVRYILTGTVRWERRTEGPGSVQVAPELVEIPRRGEPRTRWQQPFTAQLTNLFTVQSDIATQVGTALGAALDASAVATLAHPPTSDLSAYDALLRGDRILLTEDRRDVASLRQAVTAYRQAVEADSGFGLAWARLGRAASLLYVNDHQPDSLARLAERSVARAVALAPRRPETLYAQASLRLMVGQDWEGAVAVLEQSRTLAPSDVDVLSLLGSLLLDHGRGEEATTYLETAVRLDPRSLTAANRYAYALFVVHRFRESDSVAGAALLEAPDNTELINERLEAKAAQGDAPGIRAVLIEARRHVDPVQLVLSQWGTYWMLDDSLKAVARTIPARAYSEDQAEAWSRYAYSHWLLQDDAVARAAADTARVLLEQHLAQRPNDLENRMRVAWALAILGHRAEALREVSVFRDVTKPVPGTVSWVDWLLQVLHVELLSGNAAGVVAYLDSIVHLPGPVTRASLRIDPEMDRLRERPDFQRLVSSNH